jgi:hypothetical protein
MDRAAHGGFARREAGILQHLQESIMTKLSLALGIVAAALTASVALAQGGGYGPGPGAGCGGGAGMAGANCPMGGGGYGPGYGQGKGYGPGGGAQLLTPEERAQHREKMHSFTTVEQCNAYFAEHQKLIAERAKEKGLAAPTGPRGNPCERMKARGMFG